MTNICSHAQTFEFSLTIYLWYLDIGPTIIFSIINNVMQNVVEINIHIHILYVYYPVWLGRLTHLLREAQSHWPPFCFHSQLCENDTRAAYRKTRMPWNWHEYFKCLRKLGHFQQVETFARVRTITFKKWRSLCQSLAMSSGYIYIRFMTSPGRYHFIHNSSLCRIKYQLQYSEKIYRVLYRVRSCIWR